MNLPPKPPRFALPVAGAKVGSLARPAADRATEPATPIAAPALGMRRLGLRSNTRTLSSLADRVRGPGDDEAAS